MFRKGGLCKNSLSGDMHSHERLLVLFLVLFSVGKLSAAVTNVGLLVSCRAHDKSPYYIVYLCLLINMWVRDWLYTTSFLILGHVSRTLNYQVRQGCLILNRSSTNHCRRASLLSPFL